MSSPTLVGERIAGKIQLGLAHQRAGRLAEARACYSEILAADPADADALHLLGVVEQVAGNYRASVELISAAIRSKPKQGDYRSNLGNTFRLMGDLPRAAECYKQAFALNRRNLYALDQLAHVQADLGRPELAEGVVRLQALLKRELAAECCQRGDRKRELGDLQAAAAEYRQAISFEPDHCVLHSKLAGVLFLLEKFVASAQHYRLAATIEPGNADLHYCHGVALQANGDVHAAAKAYHRALVIKPDDPKVMVNLAAIFTEIGNLELSATLLKRSIALLPDSAAAYCNLGTLLLKQGNRFAATQCYEKSLELEPGYAPALCNLGLQFELNGNLETGAAYYRLAIESDPSSARSRFFLSQILLALGDFEAGWREYEARWDTPSFRHIRRDFHKPQWRGEPIAGARILVFSEQGLGDTLHFVRYLRLLAEAGAEICFEVAPALFELLGHVAGAARVICRGEPLPEFDWYCPLMSLPLAFHTGIESIPNQTPYLHADEERIRLWAARLATTSLKVGIVWSGNPSHTRERERSIPLENLARLSRLPGVVLYSLQKGPAAEQADALASELRVVNLDAEQRNFSDTAAIVANLDLVISIDTSVAHLAGAMGKPVWILLHNAPDWRWLRDREDSPWYPTARLFRQTSPGDWDTVLDRVEHDLSALVVARTTFCSELSSAVSAANAASRPRKASSRQPR